MEIEKAIIRFCAAKNIAVTKERVQMQADYLKGTDYSEAQVIEAIQSIFGETSFFPDASLILKKLKPNSSDNAAHAQIMVDKIMEANSRFGSPLEAKQFMGPDVWNIVERFGGWDCVTNLTYSDLGTARAQLRRIAESQVIVKSTTSEIEYASDSGSGLKRLDFRKLIEK